MVFKLVPAVNEIIFGGRRSIMIINQQWQPFLLRHPIVTLHISPCPDFLHKHMSNIRSTTVFRLYDQPYILGLKQKMILTQ